MTTTTTTTDFESLPEEYIADAIRDARRYQGQWTGTAGTLAAHTMRLVRERERLLKTLDDLAGTTGHDDDQAPGVTADAMARFWQAHKDRHAATAAACSGRCPDATRTVYGADGPVADEKPGTTAKFGTGAVRSDTVEEFRYDLVSPIGLREVARACAEGASKYSDFNWEKGMPVHDLLNHAIAHIFNFLAGDRSEPHLGHAAWNLMAAIHSDALWPQLNEGTLRSPGCRPPGS